MNSTEQNLRRAFRKSRLSTLGWTYAKAISNPAIRLCLLDLAESTQKLEPNAPKQMELIDMEPTNELQKNMGDAWLLSNSPREWVPSAETNIRKTFERERARLEAEKATQPTKVVRIKQ